MNAHLFDTNSPPGFVLMHSSNLYREWQVRQETTFLEFLCDSASILADCTFRGRWIKMFLES